MSGIHIICHLTGKHSRGRKHARVGRDGRLRSRCTRCGQPLIRTFNGDARVWRVDRTGVNVPDSIIHVRKDRSSTTHLDR